MAIKFADHVAETERPGKAELAALRDLHARTRSALLA
jgi:hypothetical protein